MCTLTGWVSKNDCKCSELIHCSGTLDKFGPFSGHKIRKWWFLIIICSWNPNLVCTLTEWVFKNDLLLGNIGQILSLQWPQNDWKGWFLTIIWKSIHTIQSKLVVRTSWLSVQKLLAFGPLYPNFGPQVTHNWLKMVVCEKLCGKVFTQYNSKLVSTQMVWCKHLLISHFQASVSWYCPIYCYLNSYSVSLLACHFPHLDPKNAWFK